jgi:hypothetical protein
LARQGFDGVGDRQVGLVSLGCTYGLFDERLVLRSLINIYKNALEALHDLLPFFRHA